MQPKAFYSATTRSGTHHDESENMLQCTAGNSEDIFTSIHKLVKNILVHAACHPVLSASSKLHIHADSCSVMMHSATSQTCSYCIASHGKEKLIDRLSHYPFVHQTLTMKGKN